MDLCFNITCLNWPQWVHKVSIVLCVVVQNTCNFRSLACWKAWGPSSVQLHFLSVWSRVISGWRIDGNLGLNFSYSFSSPRMSILVVHWEELVHWHWLQNVALCRLYSPGKLVPPPVPSNGLFHLQSSQKCHWCNKSLLQSSARLDHQFLENCGPLQMVASCSGISHDEF